ncbi:tetratricopeptide repeat protein [Candidatus Riflebacteria bacterium]
MQKKNGISLLPLILTIFFALTFPFLCFSRTPFLKPEQFLHFYKKKDNYKKLNIIYPLDNCQFPPEFPPPTFRFKEHNPDSDLWVIIFFPKMAPEPLCQFIHVKPGYGKESSFHNWRPEDDEWEKIRKESAGLPIQVVILGFKREIPAKVLSCGKIAFSFAKDPVEAPIFYREVNLPFKEAVKNPARYIRWRFGEITSSAQPAVILEKVPVCGNCHSFSSDGRLLGMDVDYENDKGSYALTPISEEMVLDKGKILTWSDYKREDKEKTFGLLSQVSPDGKYVISTVKDRSVFVAKPDLAYSQLFFPLKGILAYYHVETKSFHALPGADDKRYVQSNATWSPDGKYIIFARSKAYKLKNIRRKASVLLTEEEARAFLRDKKPFKFDLYKIPFNDGKGGKAEPVEGASHNGMSNFFARYSPDGKWIVFCKAKNYMLLQPDSELFIIPANGGKARRLLCNTGKMNSWHSWSPNSRWLVFSSKLNGPYTILLLAHMDKDGKSSPPIVLENFSTKERAANIPEFVNTRPGAIKKIRAEFLDDVSFERAGYEFFIQGDFKGAEKLFKKSITLNPRNVNAHSGLGFIRLKTQKSSKAEKYFRKAVELQSPDSNIAAEAHNNLGAFLLDSGRLDEAVVHFHKAVAFSPQNIKYLTYLANSLWKKGKLAQAKKYFRKAVELQSPDSDIAAEAHNNLGSFLLNSGRLDEAVVHFRKAVTFVPQNVTFLTNLAISLWKKGKLAQAKKYFEKALKQAPDDRDSNFNLGMLLQQVGRYKKAIQYLKKAKAIDRKKAKAIDHGN